jgi:uncharacterized damage-inducible protein DinB
MIDANNPLKQMLLADLEEELATTRRVLERIPDEHLGYKPHEKSMALGSLGTHLANLAGWQIGILLQDEYDFAASPPPLNAAESRDALLAAFDSNVAGVRAAVEQVDDAALHREWTLRFGENVIFKRPKALVFRSFGLSHMAHHRGQLTVYLRMLDVPLPPVYGPTADER